MHAFVHVVTMEASQEHRGLLLHVEDYGSLPVAEEAQDDGETE